MENITRIGKPGDIFINRAGQECVWIASDGKGKYKYRFRLLDEHKMREKECNYVNNELSNGDPRFMFDLNKKLWMGQVSIWGYKEYMYETGDWYVRFNGCVTCCSKWESDHDIIKKKENND